MMFIMVTDQDIYQKVMIAFIRTNTIIHQMDMAGQAITFHHRVTGKTETDVATVETTTASMVIEAQTEAIIVVMVVK